MNTPPPLDPTRRSFLAQAGAGALVFGLSGDRGSALAAGSPPSGATAKWPRVYVKRFHVEPIWSDGRHNAFPGIAQVGNYYYVTFRNAINHQSVDGSAKIFVIRSAATDLKKWEKVAEFGDAKDIRDPLVFDNQGKVQVVFHTEADYYSQSADGVTWSPVRPIESEFVEPAPGSGLTFITKRRWLFRIRRGPDGAFHSLARCGLPPKGSKAKFGLIMYRSEDGVKFKAMHTYGEGPSQVLTPEEGTGHEADVAWTKDGTFLAAIRNAKQDGVIAMGPGPLGPFRRINTGTMSFGGPALHITKKGGVLVAGRHTTPEGHRYCRVSTVLPNGTSDPLLLPSGGDCAYQGFVDGPAETILLAYYSSHEHSQGATVGLSPANIYLAHLTTRNDFPK